MKNIYLCGPTVYNDPHIGNMRPILSFDVYIRSLKYLGIETNFIHNITDIDDKIIKVAKDEKTTELAIAHRYKTRYLNLLRISNILTPNHMPTVLENMEHIIQLISDLVKNEHAYVSNGSVYFDVKKFKKYGYISNLKIDDVKTETQNKDKKNQLDFALWKKTRKGINFQSPWSKGRPGWHTECVAFISKFNNGKTLDVHGGGIDLIFPHHENENAQFETLTNKKITKKWLHVGTLNIDGTKMSKSIGNVTLAQDFMNIYGRNTLRNIFLNTKPTGPINLTEDLIKENLAQVNKFEKAYLFSKLITKGKKFDELAVEEIATQLSKWNFSNAMADVIKIFKNFNKRKKPFEANTLIKTMELLGYWFTNIEITKDDKDKYKEWLQLRKEKKFDEADEIRSYFSNKNIM